MAEYKIHMNDYRLNILFFSVLILSILGCNDDVTDNLDTISTISAVRGSGQITLVNREGGIGSFSYTHDLGSIPQDVYFVFTNTSFSDTSAVTEVSSQITGNEAEWVNGPPRQAGPREVDLETYARKNGIGLRGRPDISRFNNGPLFPNPTVPDARSKSVVGKPAFASVGDTHVFVNESISDTIASTLRSVVSDGNLTLNVWVANDAWDGCSKWYCLTQKMVDAVAAKFLSSGSNNDIYDWVTNIYGAPWGSHSFSYLIDSSASQQIDILFFDIDNDGNMTDSEPQGGIAGFFWAKDNLLSSINNLSNERLIFYMDSVLTAKPENSSWDISDQWPSDIVATLAHEFQHMIHFYQKTVLRTPWVGSEVWVNEMSSMVTEDLLAGKMKVNGPRGISYSDGTAGSSGNTSGRLPLYNLRNYYGVSDWFSSSSSVLVNYAVNYAFGAFLARNYGGAVLFRKIVQSEYTDYRAIEQAISDLGYTDSFSTVLRKWGAAVLLSDSTSTSIGYKYNNGTYFTTELNNIEYQLGSINLYNYMAGPLLFSTTDLGSLGKHFKSSNVYVRIGSGLTGSLSRTVNMPANIVLSVVTKDTG